MSRPPNPAPELHEVGGDAGGTTTSHKALLTTSAAVTAPLDSAPELHEVGGDAGGAAGALEQRLAAGGAHVGQHIVHAVGQAQEVLWEEIEWSLVGVGKQCVVWGGGGGWSGKRARCGEQLSWELAPAVRASCRPAMVLSTG